MILREKRADAHCWIQQLLLPIFNVIYLCKYLKTNQAS